MVDCQYLFHDPTGSNSTSTTGEITMGGEILGVICMDPELNASDAVLGRPGTAYHTGQSSRGYEMGAEVVELSADRRTYRILGHKSSYPGENTRILSVPAGLASYGMNRQVSATNPRPGQLLLVDYERTTADADRDAGNGPSLFVAFRHLGHANGVFVHGGVESFAPSDITSEKDIWAP